MLNFKRMISLLIQDIVVKILRVIQALYIHNTISEMALNMKNTYLFPHGGGDIGSSIRSINPQTHYFFS